MEEKTKNLSRVTLSKTVDVEPNQNMMFDVGHERAQAVIETEVPRLEPEQAALLKDGTIVFPKLDADGVEIEGEFDGISPEDQDVRHFYVSGGFRGFGALSVYSRQAGNSTESYLFNENGNFVDSTCGQAKQFRDSPAFSRLYYEITGIEARPREYCGCKDLFERWLSQDSVEITPEQFARYKADPVAFDRSTARPRTPYQRQEEREQYLFYQPDPVAISVELGDISSASGAHAPAAEGLATKLKLVGLEPISEDRLVKSPNGTVFVQSLKGQTDLSDFNGDRPIRLDTVQFSDLPKLHKLFKESVETRLSGIDKATPSEELQKLCTNVKAFGNAIADHSTIDTAAKTFRLREDFAEKFLGADVVRQDKLYNLGRNKLLKIDSMTGHAEVGKQLPNQDLSGPDVHKWQKIADVDLSNISRTLHDHLSADKAVEIYKSAFLEPEKSLHVLHHAEGGIIHDTGTGQIVHNGKPISLDEVKKMVGFESKFAAWSDGVGESQLDPNSFKTVALFSGLKETEADVYKVDGQRLTVDKSHGVVTSSKLEQAQCTTLGELQQMAPEVGRGGEFWNEKLKNIPSPAQELKKETQAMSY